MKSCQKCGKEIMDEAVVCTECGCAVEEVKTQVVEKKKTNKKKILISIGAVVALVILIVASKLFITYNPIRAMQVKKQLAGNSFVYSYNGYLYQTRKLLEFDEDAQCEYYCYSRYDDGDPITFDYPRKYKIEFKNGMVFLVFTNGYICEIQYNKYGNIEGLYDLELEELFKKF